MKSFNNIKALSAFVSAAGVAVIIGWALDITVFKSVSSSFVSMKFTTALSFFLSGVILYTITISAEGRRDVAQVILPGAILMVLLIMTTLLTSSLLGIESGLEEMFIRGGPHPLRTVVPGRPSVVTMFDFILLSACGIASLFSRSKLRPMLFYVGCLIMLTGVVAVAGYILDSPILYYSTRSSTAMALHTAVLFCICGWVLVLLSRYEARP
ncbi:MAG: hypothetical protein ACE5GY_00865 [Thermodesulfobacteriota bacterium]